MELKTCESSSGPTATGTERGGVYDQPNIVRLGSVQCTASTWWMTATSTRASGTMNKARTVSASEPARTSTVTSSTRASFAGKFIHGTLTYKGGTMDGTVQQGEFVDDMLQGRGKTTCSDGSVHEGEYLGGVPPAQELLPLSTQTVSPVSAVTCSRFVMTASASFA